MLLSVPAAVLCVPGRSSVWVTWKAPHRRTSTRDTAANDATTPPLHRVDPPRAAFRRRLDAFGGATTASKERFAPVKREKWLKPSFLLQDGVRGRRILCTCSPGDRGYYEPAVAAMCCTIARFKSRRFVAVCQFQRVLGRCVQLGFHLGGGIEMRRIALWFLRRITG